MLCRAPRSSLLPRGTDFSGLDGSQGAGNHHAAWNWESGLGGEPEGWAEACLALPGWLCDLGLAVWPLCFSSNLELPLGSYKPVQVTFGPQRYVIQSAKCFRNQGISLKKIRISDLFNKW